MHGDTVPAAELRTLGFEAVQMFFASGSQNDAQDSTPEAIDARPFARASRRSVLEPRKRLRNPRGLTPLKANRERLLVGNVSCRRSARNKRPGAAYECGAARHTRLS